MAKPVITVKSLVMKYHKADKNAVDGIDLQVAQGSFFTLLGPNGAGKTTTISILTTTLAKTSGEITVAGLDVDTQASEVRKRMGIIFQKPSLDENLTAEENIRYHAMLYGLHSYRPIYSLMSPVYKQRVQQLAEILGIDKELHHAIKTFSGGMKRKLEIIRSLMHDPQILFLDEPTTGLDPASRKNLWQYLQQVRKERHTTIFLTTHYLEEAESADHVSIINNGKIVFDGTPQVLKRTLLHEYVAVEAKEDAKLRKELQQFSTVNVESKPYKITITPKESPQYIIQHPKTPLSHLEIHTPTLEDAYLEILKHNHA